MRQIINNKIFVYLFIGILIPAIGYLTYISSGSEIEAVINVSPGTGFNKLAAELKDKGVIVDVRLFKLYALSRGEINKIKPGEYLFEKGSSKKFVLDTITRGKVRLYKVTVPEGYNMFQIADLLAKELNVNKAEFIRRVKDETVLSKWNIKGESLEGYLYPETYYFSKNVNVFVIIEKMLNTFNEKFTTEIEEQGKKFGFNKHEIVTFASIIEKETGLASERQLISAVFHNRLKRGMRLQSDPTTIYGIYERYRGNLSKNDLLEATPYNTYKIKGLPPGPIANPGIDSMRAAVNPSPVRFLYFVSKNDKSHVFAGTLIEHNANVNKYQMLR